MGAIQTTARDLKKLNERLYAPRHEYRQVDPSLFGHLDLRFYDRVRDALVGQGCTWLGDVENLTLKGTMQDCRTFIRMLVSEDQATCIGLYHPKPALWMRFVRWVLRIKLGRVIDCETELSDGGYITTSNAAAAGKLNPPPGFGMKFYPVDTAHEVVLQAHQQRLKEFLAANPGIRATTMRTTEEVLDMQHRMQAVKAAYRKAIGYVTEEELKRLGASARKAAEMKQAMDRPDSQG